MFNQTRKLKDIKYMNLQAKKIDFDIDNLYKKS